MARINVEQEWWFDDRRHNLIELFGGNEREADGLMLYLWHLSQSYWANGKKMIPWSLFEKIKDAEKAVQSGLVVQKNAFAYVRGSRQSHDWILKRKESGKRGGAAKHRNQKEKILANAWQTSSKRLASSSSSSSSSSSKKEEGDISPPPPSLVKIWNENCGNLPRVKQINAARTRLIAARWKENPSETYWIDVVKRISTSEFCCGKNDRGWMASFDFLLKPNTHLKASEGAYGGKTTNRKHPYEEEIEKQFAEAGNARKQLD